MFKGVSGLYNTMHVVRSENFLQEALVYVIDKQPAQLGKGASVNDVVMQNNKPKAIRRSFLQNH